MADKENFEQFRRILPNLEKIHKISGKIKALYNMKRLLDMDQRSSISNDIKKLLQPFYPECQVLIYGSSANGFGTHGCDLDLLFLPNPDYCKLGTENEPTECNITINMIKNNVISTEILNQMGEIAQLKFILKVLRKNRNKFRDAVLIPARCPILHFKLKSRGLDITCDLSCRNRLVVYNTKLLKFLGLIDSRVRSLTVTLRSWAKYLGIIDKRMFSSYAFTLLIIFFFQSIDPPILPSVDFLMRASESSCIVAGWEVAFVSNLAEVPLFKNTSTEGELLEHFFDFYWNFDFVRNVVSIRTGRLLPKEQLQASTDERIQKFEICDVCIQDPFNLSHNVTSSIGGGGLFLLKSSLFSAKKTLSRGTKDRFELLFTSNIDQNDGKNLFFPSVNDSLIYINLDYHSIKSFGDTPNLENIWQKRVTEAVLELLKYGLLMDCEVIDGADFIKYGSWKSDQFLTSALDIRQDNMNSQVSRLLISIQCAVYNRVWCGRTVSSVSDDDSHDFTVTNQLSNDVLKKEYIISRNLLAQNPSFVGDQPFFWFRCDCYQSKYPQLPNIAIDLTALTKSKEFKAVKIFLQSYLPKTIKRMLI